MDISESFRASKEVTNTALFAAHTLELNDIIISAALLKRSSKSVWLEEFRHERELKHTTIQGEVARGRVQPHTRLVAAVPRDRG